MHIRYPLVRSVVAVLAGEASRLALLVPFGVLVLSPAFDAVGHKPGLPLPDTSHIRMLVGCFLLWILFVVNPAGGYVAAMLAPRAYLAHGAALSILAVLIYGLEVLSSPPDQMPLPFVIGVFPANIVGILFGAWLYHRRARRQQRLMSQAAALR